MAVPQICFKVSMNWKILFFKLIYASSTKVPVVKFFSIFESKNILTEVKPFSHERLRLRLRTSIMKMMVLSKS